MADIKGELDQILYDKTLEHLAKIKNYIPGPVKKVGGTKAKLRERYSRDPLYSIFGLDSQEYITATLAGGTVTSIHRKLGDIYEDALSPYLRGAKQEGNGNLMRSYVVKYFNNLYDHASEISKVCRRRAQLAYVIGNSKFYDHPLPSDEILAAIFGSFEFELARIDRMRKRQSKAGLYEAVVFMRR